MGFHDEARAAYDARRNAVEALRAKVDDIGDAEVSEADAEYIARANAEIDALDVRVDEALKGAKREARSAELDSLIGKVAAPKAEDGEESPAIAEARSLLTLPNGSGMELSISEAERRDLVTDTGGDGAELVPTSLFGQLYRGLLADQSSMFSLGRQLVTPAGEQLDFPIMSTLSTAALVSEAGAIGESDPQFTTVSLNAYKYALAIQLSSELQDDNVVGNALSMIVDQAVEGIRKGVNAHLVTGTGSSQPNGIDNGSNASVATGVTFPTGDNLIAAYHDVVDGYRQNGTWLFNDATVLGIRQLKNAGTVDYLWQPGIAAGMPDTILGRPVRTDPNVATVGANAKVGIFGDFQRAYIVRTVGSIRAERSVDYAFLNDLVTWRFIARFDGEIIDNNAITVITNEAS